MFINMSFKLKTKAGMHTKGTFYNGHTSNVPNQRFLWHFFNMLFTWTHTGKGYVKKFQSVQESVCKYYMWTSFGDRA